MFLLTSVSSEGRALLAGLDIPQCTSHVAGARDNLVVVEEATTTQITSMTR